MQKMKTTITRRTAIAASATLPLLPVASYATPADPAVEAFRVWRAAYVAYERSCNRPNLPDDCPAMLAAQGANWRAKAVLASMIATTSAGLAGQLFMGLGLFGDLCWAGDDFDNPSHYLFENCLNDIDGRLYRNMLAGAEGMANA